MQSDSPIQVTSPDPNNMGRIETTLQEFREFRARVVTFAAILGGLSSIVVGIAAWILSGVMELRTNVAVIQADLKRTTEQIDRVREDLRRTQESSEKIGNISAKLEAIVDRPERRILGSAKHGALKGPHVAQSKEASKDSKEQLAENETKKRGIKEYIDD